MIITVKICTVLTICKVCATNLFTNILLKWGWYYTCLPNNLETEAKKGLNNLHNAIDSAFLTIILYYIEMIIGRYM